MTTLSTNFISITRSNLNKAIDADEGISHGGMVPITPSGDTEHFIIPVTDAREWDSHKPLQELADASGLSKSPQTLYFTQLRLASGAESISVMRVNEQQLEMAKSAGTIEEVTDIDTLKARLAGTHTRRVAEEGPRKGWALGKQDGE